jgi:hypothetical protein
MKNMISTKNLLLTINSPPQLNSAKSSEGSPVDPLNMLKVNEKKDDLD